MMHGFHVSREKCDRGLFIYIASGVSLVVVLLIVDVLRLTY
jgi:hypothetical protein